MTQVSNGTRKGAITGPIKWHGGKYYLARHLHEIARGTTYTHRAIAFAGGLGEFWNWEHEGISEAVNDLNGDLTNFWKVLQDEQLLRQFLRVMQAMPFSRNEWNEHSQLLKEPHTYTEPHLGRAISFFVTVRQSMAGRMTDFATLSRSRVRRGMNEQVSAWLSAINGLEDAHHRLQRVVIENEDALTFIKREDSPSTLHYLDPPYLANTRTAPNCYAFEMTEEDHENLLKLIVTLEGRVIISGYRSDLYDSQLAGWQRHEIELPNNAASGSTKRRMIECVYTNF